MRTGSYQDIRHEEPDLESAEENAWVREADGQDGPRPGRPSGDEAGRLRMPTVHARNRLVSKMLQDRGVLRLICAPRGYGKSSLVREYANRMFNGGRVEWVDASSPAFLADLDRGHMQGFDELQSEQPGLVVLDDVPWLHEERAATLSARIDTALYRGIEVVATTLPSCDCLDALQPERVYLNALDLEITEQDCLETTQGEDATSKMGAVRMWRRVCSEPFGKSPAVAWGNADWARKKMFEWFFAEKLPITLFRSVFALMLLGSGALADLGRVGAGLRDEDAELLARNYPFLCIDMTQRRFDFPRCAFTELKDALTTSGVGGLFGAKAGLFMGKVLSLLMARGEMRRVEEVLASFCTDVQCAHWLLEGGWALLDYGETDLVDVLLARCPEATFDGSPVLKTLRAWASAAVGDYREARYYAQDVLRRRDSSQTAEEEELQAAHALAYLALVAFGGGGASIFGKDSFASACSPVTAAGFMARVIDLCTDSELSRAFSADEPASGAYVQREEADEGRARALCALFSENVTRLKGEPFYRAAFHLLCSVDSELLKPVVQGVGCELVVHARRKSFLSFTDGIVVRDLWRVGFFGVMGPRTGQRDAKLLEDAGRIIRKMASCRGEEQADVPWDIESRFRSLEKRDVKTKAAPGEVALARVRLFGSFEVTVGDRYIKDIEWRKKSRLLVILVVLSQGRDVSREMLFEQLWPGMSRVRALDNFYSVWSNACNIMGDGPYLERTGAFCRVNPQYLVSDVAEFEQLTRRLLTEHPDANALLDIFARIESLYRGGLVPSETENEIINAQRERYQATYVDAMILASECAMKANDARLALWFARKAREIGSGREDVYQVLIRAQIAAGQRCSAIKTYFECREYLREELGLDPSCEVQELYDQLISVDPTLLKLEPSSFKKGRS